MESIEVEFKYRADNVTLQAFEEFCNNRKPDKIVEAAGFDHFYANTKDPDAFCRHRIGPEFNQLTFKRKTTDANNYVRTEHNLDLKVDTPKEKVTALCKEFGYTYNTSVFKTCFVYFYDWYVLSYYVCYDKDLKELGRFLEIEANEDHAWSTEQEAWDAVVVMEKICKPLGITPQMRIKRSLFELYRVQE